MFKNHPAVGWLLIVLTVLLLIPIVAMIGMMAFSVLAGGGIMSHMGGMMDGM